jgi:hypothetical protein
VHGQDVIDQFSSMDETPLPGSGNLMQTFQPVGQSFMPTLFAIDYVRFKFSDHNVGNAQGVTIVVSILAGSFNGTVLGTTAPIFMPDGFAGVTTFSFGSSIA